MLTRDQTWRIPSLPLPQQAAARLAGALVRAVQKFWEHGDLFSSAAISYYALFSMLPLAILLLLGLQTLYSSDAVMRNLSRLFGLPPSDILFTTVRGAYAEQQSLGWVGIATLVVAAAGVFSAIQAALDRVWEVRGRALPARFMVGILIMAASLLIFLSLLVATALTFRLIRTSLIGTWLGWPRVPPPGTRSAAGIASALAQFGIFWTGYRFLPSVPVRWRDALPGALLAAVVWHAIAYLLGWYLGWVADYTTLYHSLGAILALLVSVYGLSCTFLFGAEFVAQRTPWPAGRSAAAWREPVPSRPAAQEGSLSPR
jgi:membrane protein